MKKLLLCSTSIFLASIVRLAFGDTVSPRSYPICVYLERKIFCYGGVDITPQAKQQPELVTLDDFYYLDISGNFAVSNASSFWVRILSQGSLRAEPNAFYSVATVPNNNTIVFSGGVGRNDDTLLVNPAMAYNTRSNSWSVVSGNSGTQTYAAGAGIQVNDKIYIWGGVSDSATGYQNQIFQRDMRILDFNSNQWSSVSLYSIYPSRIYHVSVLGNDHRTIFYIGGEQQLLQTADNGTTYYEKQYAPMTRILQYDTVTSLWAERNTTGDSPTTRLFHAAASKPNTNEIIVYGGSTDIDANTTVAVDDFCCVLDTTMFTWKIVNLSATEGAPHRVGHSVVFLENSSYMFVLFGFDKQGQAHTDIQVLDTDAYQWVQDYQGPGPLPADEEEDGNAPDGSTSGISSGAIAGIAVGAVVAVGAVAGILFFLRRRKQQRSHKQSKLSDTNDPPPYSRDFKLSPYQPPHTHDDDSRSFQYSSNHNLSPHQIVGIVRSTPLSNTALSTLNHIVSPSQSSSNPSQPMEPESMKPDGSQAYYVPRLALHPVKPDHSR